MPRAAAQPPSGGGMTREWSSVAASGTHGSRPGSGSLAPTTASTVTAIYTHPHYQQQQQQQQGAHGQALVEPSHARLRCESGADQGPHPPFVALPGYRASQPPSTGNTAPFT